jgi:hypothetical protein
MTSAKGEKGKYAPSSLNVNELEPLIVLERNIMEFK